MNNPNGRHVEDEEVMEGEITQAPDIGTLAVLNKSEIDQQIATARRFPRSIVNFRKEALQLATLDEQTAAECIYALPRAGKTIEGPSARFAEIVNYAWGNTRAGARVVAEDEEFVTSQGLFYDLEKNTAISYEVKRRIVDSRNKRYNADMIGTTSNAASSIGLRNAILKGIPKALWNPIYKSARAVVAGDVRTLVSRRDEAIKAFAIFGVTPEMIFATLGVNGVQDVSIDHLVILKGILTAIQEGDTTPEQAFSQQTVADHKAHQASQATAADLAAKYGNKGSDGSAVPPSANPPTASEQTTSHPPQEAPAPQSQPVEQTDKSRSRRQTQRTGQEQHGQPLTFTEPSRDREPGEDDR
jgi:hypothetical protein